MLFIVEITINAIYIRYFQFIGITPCHIMDMSLQLVNKEKIKKMFLLGLSIASFPDKVNVIVTNF